MKTHDGYVYVVIIKDINIKIKQNNNNKHYG